MSEPCFGASSRDVRTGQSVVILSASSELDDRLLRVIRAVSAQSRTVLVLAPGHDALSEELSAGVTLRRVPLVPSPRTVPASVHPVWLIRVALNLIVLTPLQWVARRLRVDWRWVLLDYPELVADALAVRADVVCADGDEMLRPAYQVCAESGCAVLLSRRLKGSDRRMGVDALRWYQRLLLHLRAWRYRRATIIDADEETCAA